MVSPVGRHCPIDVSRLRSQREDATEESCDFLSCLPGRVPGPRGPGRAGPGRVQQILELRGQQSESNKPEVSGLCRTGCPRGESYEEKELRQSAQVSPGVGCRILSGGCVCILGPAWPSRERSGSRKLHGPWRLPRAGKI